MIPIVTTPITRRRALAGLAAFAAAPPTLSARSHFARNRVSAVTDEIGKTQADAIAVAEKYKLALLELRRVPGADKEFAALTGPELKRAAAELALTKIRVVMLHASTLRPETVTAAALFGASKILIEKPDAQAIAAQLSALEQARIQLLIPDSADTRTLLERFPSKAFGVDWDPVRSPDAWSQAPKGRILNLRVQIETEAGWRRRLESLDRENYQGGVSLSTTFEKSDDALHDILRLVDDL
jgi:hypothetical protein